MMRLWLIAFLLCALGCVTAQAHPMPNSVIALDIGEDAVVAELAIPLIELDLALGTDLSSDPAGLVPAASEQIGQYLAEHIGAYAPDGTPWAASVGDVNLAAEVDNAKAPYGEIAVRVVMTPPAGASVRSFALAYDAVIHRVVTHYVVVTVCEDWLNGQIDAEQTPVSVGVIRLNPTDGNIAPLAVDLSQGSYWQGFLAMLGLGASHIAEGTDHLLFLLTLLLPAPLLAVGPRWGAATGTRATLVSVIKIVTAFTLGHSLMLILATVFRLDLPQQPIEVVIALTILLGAIHAFRPIFPGREPTVAALFGLVHGLAFSFTLVELDLSIAQLAISLLGFNLGIELFQLAIVPAILPSLLLLARSGFYTPVRIGVALVATLAALAWLADRLGLSSSAAMIADGAGAYLPALVLALTLAGGIAWLAQAGISRITWR